MLGVKCCDKLIEAVMVMMMMWLQVLGVECCGKLIDAALRLQTGATLAYGDGWEATLDSDVHPERVIFKQVSVPAKMYFLQTFQIQT